MSAATERVRMTREEFRVWDETQERQNEGVEFGPPPAKLTE